jgi:hypothetical protein
MARADLPALHIRPVRDRPLPSEQEVASAPAASRSRSHVATYRRDRSPLCRLVTLSAFSLLSFAGRIAGIASRLPLARLPGLILHAFERASIEPALRDSKLTEDVGPRVRIPFAPAASQVRTCLSREFAFLRREAAVFRGCAGRGERRGRQRRAGRGNIGPTGGNISVGPYSSTAPPVDVGGLMIPVVFEFGSGSENRARRFEAAILSRMRSLMTSRSNCAKDNKTLRVRRPIRGRGVEMLRHRNKGRAPGIQDLDDLGKIGDRAGQPPSRATILPSNSTSLRDG